jgi:hypothetical protein
MIIPFTVLALAWFIVINHVYVRRVRANKASGFGHTFYKETTSFLYRFLVVGAAFSTVAVLLMGINNDHTKVVSLVRLQRTVDGAERGLRMIGLTPATTFVLVLLVYGLLLAVRHGRIKWPARLAQERPRVDHALPGLLLFAFIVFFLSRIGDASLDPTLRIREIREGYAAYRAELRRELADRVAFHGTAQLRATTADLQAIDKLRDSLWGSRESVLAAYAAAPVQAGTPIRVARVDTVRTNWTDAERQILRRLDGIDVGGSLERPVMAPGEEIPRWLSVQKIRDLREDVARVRERRHADQSARAVVLGDAVTRTGGAAITMFLADVPEPVIQAELRERLADFERLDPTLSYLPSLFLDAADSRLRARFADQAIQTIGRRAESEDSLAAVLDTAAVRVAAELQKPTLDATVWVGLERQVRAAIEDARARRRAIEVARQAAARAAARPATVAEAAPSPPPSTPRVDTLWNELVGFWLTSEGAGQSFTMDLRGNDELRQEATRLLGHAADTVTLTPPVEELRALSESYRAYVRELGGNMAERELDELVQAAKAESSPARRTQMITTRVLQRVPQALSAGLKVQ